eukprot:488640-Alexandrium_andersonii.AAC.1
MLGTAPAQQLVQCLPDDPRAVEQREDGQRPELVLRLALAERGEQPLPSGSVRPQRRRRWHAGSRWSDRPAAASRP